ncbi:Flp family type IVb pilin [Blastococcus litoris]|uniref:Flp family type IVb pilin n=1 Tax=Blastococcus litoris TaxID=2171622 RepID=UPI000E309BE8|nr:Flp family type IVb pilin [Blastococcus litoris]
MLNLFTALQILAFDVTDRLKREEKGASAVEYALLVGLIAAAVVAAVALFGPKLNTLFTNINVNGK